MKEEKENRMKKTKKEGLIKDKRGLSTVEYIIILVLIAASGISLWSKFGDTLKTNIESATDAVGSIQVDQ